MYDNKQALTHSFMVGYPRILNSEAMPRDTRIIIIIYTSVEKHFRIYRDNNGSTHTQKIVIVIAISLVDHNYC